MKTIRSLASLVALAALAAAVPAQAADVYQISSADSGKSWETGSLWDNGAAASAGNNYFTNGYTQRSPDAAAGSSTFAGDLLTVDGGTGSTRGTLSLKSGTTTIANLSIGVGTINNAVAGSGGNLAATLNVTDLTVLAAATSANAAIIQGAFSNNNFTVNATNLLGSGYLQFSNPRDYTLSVADATAFTGTLNLKQGSLTLSSSLSMNNAVFSMATGSSLVLTNDLAVSAFTFGTTDLNSGVYTSSDLNTLFSTSAFSGAGSVSVGAIPEPSAAALAFGGIALVAAGLRRRGSRG